MNENVGASFGLSLLVVLFFAVALYQPDKPTAKLQSKVTVKASPQATAVVTPTRVAEVKEKPSAPARRVSQRVVEETSKRVDVRKREPRGAFTSVRAGERLEDIALRVYGTAGATEKLWKANRDLVDHADEILKTGMLVRTP